MTTHLSLWHFRTALQMFSWGSLQVSDFRPLVQAFQMQTCSLSVRGMTPGKVDPSLPRWLYIFVACHLHSALLSSLGVAQTPQHSQSDGKIISTHLPSALHPRDKTLPNNRYKLEVHGRDPVPPKPTSMLLKCHRRITLCGHL